MDIIIFDFEVFKYDTLLGCKIIKDDSTTYFQTWDVNEIKKFYGMHLDCLWVGHNNCSYDNLILEACVMNKNPYVVSQEIISGQRKRYSNLDFINYDLMYDDYYSLKATEAVNGKNISETQVDFNIDRPLTEEEKVLTESYNRDDLDQTEDNFFDNDNFGNFRTRLDIIEMFNLPTKFLTKTGTQVAAKVLGAKAIPGIEEKIIKPISYDNLQVKNKEVLDFYYQEKFRKGESLETIVCGLTHKLGAGGIHGAINKYRTKKALYCDVSGYYNLIMMNFDLFPRTMPTTSKELYKELYYKQLEFKKTAPEKRAALKVILLSVYGATLNKYTDFYDPQKGLLVTITGQLFTVDLLEKLEGLIRVIQSNTDGIIIEPYDWNDEAKIISIIEEWEKRTGFVIKKDHIYDIVQRDVNNYMYRDEKGEIHCKGEAVKHYDSINHKIANRMFDSKEAVIISKCVVNYYMKNELPQQTINENKDNMLLFQQLSKKNTYDYLTYEVMDVNTQQTETKKLQNINRVFALNAPNLIGMVYKHKNLKDGKHKKDKVSNLPTSVFVYNEDIRTKENIEKLKSIINYDYYVQRAWERIREFSTQPLIKDIKL